MSYNEDGYDEQYEEYYRRYEEEEILNVDGGILKHEYDEDYWMTNGEYIRSNSPMVKKNLAEIIEACENMPHYYEDYLALGRNICANLSFGDYIYFKYGFWPKHDYDNYFKSIKLSIEEPICSTSLRKEEEEGTKGKDSSKPSAYSRFKSLFGFSSNTEYCDMSTPKYEKS